MTIAVCIDDKNGMLFNNRRQSQDRVLIEDLVALSNGRKISISPFSKELFAGDEVCIVEEHFPDKADEDTICFVENIDLTAYADKIQKIILYRWNRHYPSSLKFKLDLSPYTLTEQTDFPGSSHEKITREVYVR